MRWIIIGTGNVAWHFTHALAEVGETVVGVVSRDITKATAFVKSLPTAIEAYTMADLKGLQASAIDVYMLAVADDAIEEAVSALSCLPAGIAVHTSGSRALSVLQPLTDKGWKTGIFYPLQTLSREKIVHWANVPLLLECTDLPALDALKRVAERISSRVAVVDSAQRRWLHVAAVMTANFMHHLCTIGEELLTEKKIPFGLLEPLLRETLEKALMPLPASTQTGPARRGDTKTIAQHLALLEEYPTWQKVYEVLTNSLLEMYGKK